MSFINMMANDVWTDADIDNRVRALIRSKVSAEDELKAARLARAASRSADDTAFIEFVDASIQAAVDEGRAASADMALLRQVFDVEAAMRRVAMPVVEPVIDDDGNVTNQDAIDADQEERATAQLVIDAASPEAAELIEQRNPPEPEPSEGAPNDEPV
jgi:hypothetical protein